MSTSEAQRRCEELLERAEAVCAVDAEYRITHVNEAQVRMSGVPREQSVGRSLWEVWPELDAPGSVFAEHYRRCMNERVEVVFEAWFEPLKTWFRLRVAPLQTGGFAIYFRDVSAQRQFEQDLRTSEAQLRLFVEHAPASIALFDRDMRYLAHSRRLITSYGLPSSESLVGLKHYERFPHVPERWRAIHRAALEDGQPRRADEDAFIRPDGKKEWVQWEVVPWRDATGAIGGLVLFTEVITRYKDAQEALALQLERTRVAEEQLRHAQKMEAVGRLAGGIAHDFNNVMTIILAGANFIAESLPAGNELRAEAEEIARAGERAAALTRQLLAFGRKQPSSPVPVDVNAALARDEALFRRLLPEQGRLTLELGAELPRCLVDPDQLEQALLNLVINARDAMPRGGELRLATGAFEVDEALRARQPSARPGPHVLISVSDTGDGMTSGVLEHLFEPFFTTKPFGKGTGLGLAMVYGIVQQHGGSIRVQSAPGQGATFAISFPLA